MKRLAWTVALDPSRTHESLTWAEVEAVEADVEEGGALTFRDDDGVIVAAFAGGAEPAWVSARRVKS